MSFLSAGFCILNLIVLPLEATAVFLIAHLLLDEVLRSLLLVDATRIPLCWSFDNGAHLRESRYLAFPQILLVVSVRVEDIAHLDELKVALERSRELCLWQIVPLCTSACLIVL